MRFKSRKEYQVLPLPHQIQIHLFFGFWVCSEGSTATPSRPQNTLSWSLHGAPCTRGSGHRNLSPRVESDHEIPTWLKIWVKIRELIAYIYICHGGFLWLFGGSGRGAEHIYIYTYICICICIYSMNCNLKAISSMKTYENYLPRHLWWDSPPTSNTTWTIPWNHGDIKVITWTSPGTRSCLKNMVFDFFKETHKIDHVPCLQVSLCKTSTKTSKFWKTPRTIGGFHTGGTPSHHPF